jgi:micrococcal nuclease
MARRRRLAIRWWILLLMVLVAALRFAQREPLWAPDPQQPVRVKRVIDGDTLVIANGDRVRLLGIDTPELGRGGHPAEPWAEAARDFLKTAVEGRDISLGFDREPTDKYGRRLAYVYRNGTLINEEIIRAGFSRAVTRFPYHESMKVRFRNAEREARTHKRGLWSASASSSPSVPAEEFQHQ